MNTKEFGLFMGAALAVTTLLGSHYEAYRDVKGCEVMTLGYGVLPTRIGLAVCPDVTALFLRDRYIKK